MTSSDKARQDRETVHGEHHVQLELLDALTLAVGSENPPTPPGVLLDRFFEFTRLHFVSEELLMQVHGYPDLPAHRKAHSALLERFDALVVDHRRGDRELTPEAVVVVRAALATHIARDDEEFDAFLQEKTGVAPTGE